MPKHSSPPECERKDSDSSSEAREGRSCLRKSDTLKPSGELLAKGSVG